MKLRYGAILLPGAGIGLAIPTAAAERKIERSALPTAVKRTVDVETRGASIRGFSQETEGGNTYYEVEAIAGGQHKDILIDSQGTVVEIEQEVSTDSLSAEVRTGLLDNRNRLSRGNVVARLPVIFSRVRTEVFLDKLLSSRQSVPSDTCG